MVHVRFPRGKGKTSWMKVAAVWSAAYGHRKYQFIGAANQTNAESILSDIWLLCETGAAFAEDFPEIVLPILHLDGRMQRCAVQTCGGKRTRVKRGLDKIAFPTVEGYDSSGVIVIARGRESGVRGLIKGSQRPDHAAIDDPQTRKTAKSGATSEEIAAWIVGDILGLAGHDKGMSAVMATTPIFADDVSDRFADTDLHPEWTTITVPLVIRWPDRADLWDQYLEIRRRDEAQGAQNFPNATEFYRTHRAEMDAGAELLDDGDGDPKTEISGLQHAYNLLFKHGKEAFETEFQLTPPRGGSAFTLSSKAIAAAISMTPRLALPTGFHSAVSFVDCMAKDALRWVVLGVGNERR
jgi:hypothetical protein